MLASKAHEPQAPRMDGPDRRPPAQGAPGALWGRLARQPIQHACDGCEDEQKLARKEDATGAPAVTAEAQVEDTIGSAGQPLEPWARDYFGARLGRDFADVRVHTDVRAAASAKAVNAAAYTVGNHVVFAGGRYEPATPPGQRLIAHELTHVAQQAAAPSGLERSVGDVSRRGDPSEREADMAAERTLAGETVTVGRAPSAAVQRTEDWDFTAADLDALHRRGLLLRFGADSAWFPSTLRANLLRTLDYVLPLSGAQQGTTGVNRQDFYHGHVGVRGALPADAQRLLTTHNRVTEREQTAATGSPTGTVTTANVGAFGRAIARTTPSATALLNRVLHLPNVVVVYHTFEQNPPSGMAAGSPRRNYITPMGSAPQGFTPPDPNSASSVWGSGPDQYTFVMSFSFLVDENGVIHVRPGTVGESRALPAITGVPNPP